MVDTERIGRYTIVDTIGCGSMGTVFRAVDPSFDRVVAIKTVRWDMPSASSLYPELRERFHREASILGSLSHPNITALYDMGETDSGQPYMAMEFHEGRSLRDILKRDVPIEATRAFQWLEHIAAGIDYAHGEGIVHRDLKPANILIGGDGVKITDFGIARALDTSFTTAGHVLGTPSYMAPEQASSEVCTPLSDIFSFGVIAFELLSGEHPFPGENISTILYRVVHAEPVRPARLRDTGVHPDGWADVFADALDKTPERRPSTATELVARLASLYEAGPSYVPHAQATMTISVPEDVHATRNRVRRPRYLRTAVAAIGALAALTAGTALLAPRSSPPVPLVETAAAETTAPTPDVTGELSIQSVPGGATVTLNGAEKGQTPLDLTGLALENHVLRIEKEGYEAVSLTTALSIEHSRTELSVPLRKAAATVDDEPLALALALDQPEPADLPPTTRTIDASVALTENQLVIQNDNAFDWTNVELVVAPFGRTIQTARIKARGTYTLALSNLWTGPRRNVASVTVSISCESPAGEPLQSTVSSVPLPSAL